MIRSILKTGLIAGTLDALAAIMILAKMDAVRIFQYIASGVFGPEAFSGGWTTILTGVLFHYFIATSFTTFFYIILPYVPLLRKQPLATAVVYGLFVWCVMNLIVVPMSSVTTNPFNWSRALLNIAILIVCIGLPISFFGNRYYAKKNS